MAGRVVNRSVAAVVGLGLVMGAGVVPAQAASGRAAVGIHATKKHVVKAPATVRPGRVRLHNSGKLLILIFRGKSSDRAAFAKAMNAKSTKKARAAFKRFTMIDFLFPHQDDVVVLGKGSYLMADGSAKVKAERVSVLHVKGKRRDAANPETARIGANSHWGLSGSSTTSHRPWLTFANHSAQPVIFSFLRVSRSASEADVQDVIAHPTRQHMYENWDSRVFAMPAIVGQHRSVTSRLGLPKGRYFVLAEPFFKQSRALHAGDIKLVSLG